jgi:hypothetical protein
MTERKYFDSNIKIREIRQGDHVTGGVNNITREYRSANKALERQLNNLSDNVESIRGGIPDYDTGYMYVEGSTAGEEYTINHNLGQYPSRWAVFYCDVEEPKKSLNDIYPISHVVISDVGVELKFRSPDIAILTTGINIHGTDTNGYIRVMLWR